METGITDSADEPDDASSRHGSWRLDGLIFEIGAQGCPEHDRIWTWGWRELAALTWPPRISPNPDPTITSILESNFRTKRWISLLRAAELTVGREFSNADRGVVVEAIERVEPLNHDREKRLGKVLRTAAAATPAICAGPALWLAAAAVEVSLTRGMYWWLQAGTVALGVLVMTSSPGPFVASTLVALAFLLSVATCAISLVGAIVGVSYGSGDYVALALGFILTLGAAFLLTMAAGANAVRRGLSKMSATPMPRTLPMDIMLAFVVRAAGQIAMMIKFNPHERGGVSQAINEAALATEVTIRRVPPREDKELRHYYRTQAAKIALTLRAHEKLLINPDPRRAHVALSSLCNGIEHLANGRWEALAVDDLPIKQRPWWRRVLRRVGPAGILLGSAVLIPALWPGLISADASRALIVFAVLTLFAPDPGKAVDFVGKLASGK